MDEDPASLIAHQSSDDAPPPRCLRFCLACEEISFSFAADHGHMRAA
jgi:hypothetical protein